MNAETRAKEIVVEATGVKPEHLEILAKRRQLDQLVVRVGQLQNLIAQAIRQAENDKLEEARLIASAKIPKDVPSDEYERGRNNAACEISIEIERLKSNQPLDIVKVGTAAFERGLNSKRKD